MVHADAQRRRARVARSRADLLAQHALAAVGDPVHRARQRRDVHAAARVLAERRERRHRRQPRVARGRLAALEGRGPDLAEAVVAEDVAAGELRHGGVAGDRAADDRAEARGVRERERRLRRHEAGGRRVRPRKVALLVAPAEVQAADPGRGDVDLLDLVLPHVADDHRAGRAVEREAIRVAQAHVPDLGGRRGERVARGDRVAAGRVRRDAQDLPQQGVLAAGARVVAHGHVLTVAVGVVLAAPVADADVERAVGSDLHLAPVVVGLQAVGQRERRHAVGQRAVGVRRIAQPLLHAQRAVGRRVEDPEATARRVVGRERQREQAPLAVLRRRARAEVEEGRRLQDAVAHDADRPAALDHEHARGVAGRRGDVRGRREVADLDELERVRVARRRGKGEQRRQHRGRGPPSDVGAHDASAVCSRTCRMTPRRPSRSRPSYSSRTSAKISSATACCCSRVGSSTTA